MVRRQGGCAGFSTVEYTVVVLLLALTLWAGMDGVLALMREHHAEYTWSMALP
jgi:Flp pilus assembly pilin Flp